MAISLRFLVRSPAGGRLGRRVPQLFAGLVLYGVSLALIIRAGLGNAPWDVLHQGITRHVPLSIGTVLMIVSGLLLLVWIPLREKPGLGTICNAIVVGPAADLGLAVFTQPDPLAARIAMVVAGVVLNAVATALYLGSGFGAGPRDGLMTGLHRVTGRSLRLVRTGLEVTVVSLGFVLGGTLGAGTVLYALAIGPLSQLLIPWFAVELETPSGRRLRRDQRRVAISTAASEATITSAVVNRSSTSQRSRKTSTRP